MDARMDPVVLWARASTLAAVTCLLGVAGHVGADGLLPGPVVLVLLLAAAVAGSLALLSRPASMRRLVVLLVGGQSLVHLVLTVTAGHTGETRAAAVPHPGPAVLPTEGGRRIGSLQDQYAATLDPGAVTPALPVGHLVSDLQAHAPMMAAHLLAAALVGVWLAVGERTLWTLLALATGYLLRPVLLAWALLRTGVVAVRRPAPPSREPPGARTPARLARCVVRRGPPALLAA